MKCIASGGHAPPAEDAAEILRRFRERDFKLSRPGMSVPPVSDNRGNDLHVERVLTQVDAGSIRAAGLRVVLDPNNGAGGIAGRQLLEALGCEVIALNDTPNGEFTHDPEPLAENMQQLAGETARHGAAVGFGQDPDADRLAIVDERGRYIGEEYTLVLAAARVLEKGPAGCIAANLSTSRMIDDVARRHPGAEVRRTPVGEAHVARAILDNDCVIGGEGNGGVIDPRISPVRDSLSAMSHVLQLIAQTGSTVSELVAALPRYSMIKRKFPCSRERVAAVVEAVAQAFVVVDDQNAFTHGRLRSPPIRCGTLRPLAWKPFRQAEP